MAGILDKLKKQNFGKDDSLLASTAMHPLQGMLLAKQWFDDQVNTGLGRPTQPTDEGDMYARAPLDIARLLASSELAGLAETGSIPFSPKSSGGILGTVARKADDLPETEFSKAHKIAQKNAALPIDQGGLNLPPDNTAMDRAMAMGFDTKAYHGTRPRSHVGILETPDIINAELSPGMFDIPDSFYSTKDSYYANTYAREGTTGKGAVYPIVAKSKLSQIDDRQNEIRTLTPKAIRSIFAAFDPKKKDSANILAGILLGTTLLQQDKGQ